MSSIAIIAVRRLRASGRLLAPCTKRARVQVAVRRGTARCYDHAQLVHAQWAKVARDRIGVLVKRVATDDNIADIPSREGGTPAAMVELQASFWAPRLPSEAGQACTWEVLQERWRLSCRASVSHKI